jgi:hypothetical protein
LKLSTPTHIINLFFCSKLKHILQALFLFQIKSPNTHEIEEKTTREKKGKKQGERKDEGLGKKQEKKKETKEDE